MPQQRRKSNGRLSGPEAARRARAAIEELLGRPTDTISGFEPDGDGDSGWVVTVEVVEVERIPESTSLLASYEARLDENGELVGIRRLRRYGRNQAGGDEE